MEWLPIIVQLLGMSIIGLVFVMRMEGQTKLLAEKLSNLADVIREFKIETRSIHEDHENRIRSLERAPS